ncbi:carbon monoxide dehydrogenase [Ureibacillus composti]|nr:carbon monoxide dehydrogenase [Ureibacillus composti]
MNKSFLLKLFAFCTFTFVLNNGTIYANLDDTPPSLEGTLSEAGYKSVSEAVEEFENHFSQVVSLPKTEPSIDFTHRFGKFFNDPNYDMNDALSIHFLNESTPENHFKVDIRPIQNKLFFHDRSKQQALTLSNGQQAIYFENELFNFLVFENNHWQYMLGIDKRVSNKVTTEELVKIANSI